MAFIHGTGKIRNLPSVHHLKIYELIKSIEGNLRL